MKTTRSHRHRVKSSVDKPFTGSVSDNENHMAHGGTRVVETCRCGAVREANINGCHVEQGEWYTPDPYEEDE